LEVSEEKANQRVEEFKRQLKSLTGKLKEAENRAELAEKTVKKLQKEVDRLEGMLLAHFQILIFFFKILALNQNKLKKSFQSDKNSLMPICLLIQF
jgi:dsDNA-specific endonuclease/ATPase MutS2